MRYNIPHRGASPWRLSACVPAQAGRGDTFLFQRLPGHLSACPAQAETGVVVVDAFPAHERQFHRVIADAAAALIAVGVGGRVKGEAGHVSSWAWRLSAF